LIGGVAGITVGFLLLVGASTAIWLQSRKAPIDHTNVNHEWEGNLTAGTSEQSVKPKTPEVVLRGRRS
jgi:inorganic phosphate transporter, PiT family